MNDIEITATGNVCSEVRSMTTESGVPLASFRLASTPRRNRGGQWSDGPTTFVSVTCWRAMAEHVASSVSKGDPLIVQGRLSMRAWEADGRSGQTLEIDAYALGHDLRWGESDFTRSPRKEPERSDADTVAADLATSFEREAVPDRAEEAAA